jgi:hypothetical protein
MEHSFPSPLEISEGYNMAVARKYIFKLISQSYSQEVQLRLKDPHLLLYLSEIIDIDIVSKLCSFLSGNYYYYLYYNKILKESSYDYVMIF